MLCTPNQQRKKGGEMRKKIAEDNICK